MRVDFDKLNVEYAGTALQVARLEEQVAYLSAALATV
jgi:hypothetical protein